MDIVALETIRELQKMDKENEYFIFVSPGPDHCLQESENMHIIELKCSTYPLWEQVVLPRSVAKIKPDLLHCTSNTAPIFTKTPLVLTLHDIIFLEKRNSGNNSWYQEMGRYYRRWVVPRILPKCKKIITVSFFERNKIKEALGLSDEQITTVYNGYNNHFTPAAKDPVITGKYMETEGFLFYLGNTDPKKNSPRVLKAYSLYLDRSTRKRPLLIADLREEILNAIIREEGLENIKPHITCPGYIPNQDLVAVYNGAFAFLYPSLRESFGIPILESMACGTPVIAGNISAMPEITGEYPLLVDPYSPEEIAEKLLLLEQDDAFYQEQVQYGLERVSLFSWKNSAENLLKIYQELNVG